MQLTELLSPPQRLLAFFSSLVRRPQEFPLWWNLVPLCRMEVFLFSFFFTGSASRVAVEPWTVGQTFEANLWESFGFLLSWVCIVSVVFL